MLFVFFFQAEDGIRDVAVTGVQTCALPICADRECTNGRPFGCRWEANWQLLHSQEFLGLGKIQLESRDRRPGPRCSLEAVWASLPKKPEIRPVWWMRSRSTACCAGVRPYRRKYPPGTAEPSPNA